MLINCLPPLSPSAFIRRSVWDEVVTEANKIYTYVCITGTGCFTSAASQLFIGLITHIPLPRIKREEGLLAVKTIYYHLI